ncbi:putative serine acetyltransferase 1 [Iris pallida]|uniref:Serine acetyltransferase 1 n=1 Tax=Iris pallida TaxID=29817 RepID=A0AAX6H519_IRIPA|nr:putative serine acetyltransferase 1 [Iris pallida]
MCRRGLRQSGTRQGWSGVRRSLQGTRMCQGSPWIILPSYQSGQTTLYEVRVFPLLLVSTVVRYLISRETTLYEIRVFPLLPVSTVVRYLISRER